jgi:sugar-phosphatase
MMLVHLESEPVVTIEVAAMLFDLDGVLADSTSAVERHWAIFAQRHGLDAAEVLNGAHGRRSADTIARWLAPELVAAELAWYDHLEVDDVKGVICLPGANELLSALPDDRWCVVTSCGHDLAVARLRAAGLRPPTRIIGADDVVRGKPDPEPYQAGLVLMGTKPEQSIVFEDAPSGIASAHGAGIDVVGLLSTHSRAEVQARYVVGDLRAVSVLDITESCVRLAVTVLD